MTVKDLIAQLSKLEQDIEVLCCTEDRELLAANHAFRLLDIESVDVSEGERRRAEDNAPTLKLGKSANSSRFAIINVACDF